MARARPQPKPETYPIASCVECGVLAWVRRVGQANYLHDISGEWQPRIALLFGPLVHLAQGFGIAEGGPHICPPIDPAQLSSEPDAPSQGPDHDHHGSSDQQG